MKIRFVLYPLKILDAFYSFAVHLIYQFMKPTGCQDRTVAENAGLGLYCLGLIPDLFTAL